MTMSPRKALVLVDVQNDFLPGGSLAVPEGDQIIPVLNRYIELFRRRGLPIYATRDWHPERTRHFQAYGGLWPPHCVQDTPGAQFHPDLALPPETIIVSKGMDPNEDSYSGFQGKTPEGLDFAEELRQRGIEHLYIGGVATDYCVRHTVLDARRAGFRVTVLEDAIRGVDLTPGDSERARQEMAEAGAAFARLQDVAREMEVEAPSAQAHK